MIKAKFCPYSNFPSQASYLRNQDSPPGVNIINNLLTESSELRAQFDSMAGAHELLVLPELRHKMVGYTCMWAFLSLLSNLQIPLSAQWAPENTLDKQLSSLAWGLKLKTKTQLLIKWMLLIQSISAGISSMWVAVEIRIIIKRLNKAMFTFSLLLS